MQPYPRWKKTWQIWTFPTKPHIVIWPRVSSSPPLIHFSSTHSVCFWSGEPFQNMLKLNLDNPLVPELHALNSFRVRHEAIPHSQPPVGAQRGEDFKRSCRYLNFGLVAELSTQKLWFIWMAHIDLNCGHSEQHSRRRSGAEREERAQTRTPVEGLMTTD